jgi:hypothetical protein
VRTRLATLALVTLIALPAWAAPALDDQGPATGAAPGSGSAHSLLSAAPGSGSGGSGSGSGGSGTSGSGSGGPGSDDSRSATGTSPHHSNSSRYSDSRPGLRAGPEPASQAGASAAEPAPPAATSAAEPSARAPATAAASAPPVGSVADRREGLRRPSTPSGLAAVAGVAGGALLAPDPAARPAAASQVLALLDAAMPADAPEEDRLWPDWATGRWQASAMARPPLVPRPA